MIIQKIKIHYSLIFLLIISLFSGSFLKILSLFSCIFLHEMFHYLVLKHYNVKINKIELSVIGGVLDFEYSNFTPKQSIIVDLAGIIANLLIITIIKLLKIDSFNYLISYNIVLIIFNLLPIIPLDGYRLLKDILLIIYEEEFTFAIIKKIDICCLIMLFIIFLILKLYGLILLLIFLLYKLIKYNIDNKKMYKLINLLKK